METFGNYLLLPNLWCSRDEHSAVFI